MASITYNNHTTTVPDGKVATLPCNGQIMKSDIAIGADTFTILNCNSVKTPIEEGKTATLPCKNNFMGYDISVDTKRCLIVIYDNDDKTVLDKVALTPGCTISVEDGTVNNHSVKLTMVGADGVQHTANYSTGNGAIPWGVSESHYFETRYKKGTSFTLAGRTLHRISLRTSLSVGDYPNVIFLLGLGYVDGFPILTPTNGDNITWGEWVVYEPESGSYNKRLNAQIIDGNVYTSDGEKVLYTADGARVKSTDLMVKRAYYTFADV